MDSVNIGRRGYDLGKDYLNFMMSKKELTRYYTAAELGNDFQLRKNPKPAIINIKGLKKKRSKE